MFWSQGLFNERVPLSSEVPSRVVEVLISSLRSSIPLAILSGSDNHEERVLILPPPLRLTLRAMSWLRDTSNELVPLSSEVPSRVADSMISSSRSLTILAILSGSDNHEERVMILPPLLSLTLRVMSWLRDTSNELVPLSSEVPLRVVEFLISSLRSSTLMGSIFVVSRT